ncbi:Ribosome biosis regulatory protein-like [Hondaea fermentalgiana]|uniref:Ribosome biogenesis regulatory protein n=1 Tax=Hondaea fermentalgiana TaxID=2315210 RepID=A0A2R5G714_9STRA|nr:Ribosome biosis regulatory protein-like [Hondaea fermentalgiana]|eukprot:GBG26315.1 Ribosome biosis regulatory protein-like [Hondaea fermentalgiana]
MARKASRTPAKRAGSGKKKAAASKLAAAEKEEQAKALLLQQKLEELEKEAEDDVDMEDDDEEEENVEVEVEEDEEADEQQEQDGAANRFEDSSGEEEEDEEESDDDDDDDDEEDGEPGSLQNGKRNGLATASKAFTSDLGHVAAFNTTPLDPSKASSNAYLRDMALQNLKLMFHDLMELPGVEGSKVLKELPQPQFKLPRHKPIPKPKPETRWEKYARENNIEKRKRERMIWDEAKQEWAPRWGFNRANDDQHDWLIEVKDNEDPDTDKFSERRNAKKLRVLNNRKKFLRNKAEADQKQSVHEVENLNVSGARSGSSKRGKSKVMNRLATAQVSTASLGRFDATMEGEPARQLKVSKKRKFEPVESTRDADRDKKILSKLLGKHIGGDSSAEQSSSKSAKKRAAKGRGKKKGRN